MVDSLTFGQEFGEVIVRVHLAVSSRLRDLKARELREPVSNIFFDRQSMYLCT